MPDLEQQSPYGQRNCLFCGREFAPLKPGQVTCSEECRIKRRKAIKKASNRRDTLRDKIDQLTKELAAKNVSLETRVLELGRAKVELQECQDAFNLKDKELKEAQDELATVRAERDQALAELDAAEKSPPAPAEKGKARESVEEVAAKAGISLQECPRLRLKAARLPCHEYEVCEGCPGPGKEGSWPLEPGERRCAICGQPFVSMYPRAKYCSGDCRRQALKSQMLSFREKAKKETSHAGN